MKKATWILSALTVFLLLEPARAKDKTTVVDIAGRRVSVVAPVERMILGEGRHLPAVAIFDRDDPSRRIVGMLGDFKRFDPDGYAQYRAKFPAIDRIPEVGRVSADSFSVEKTIALKPDVAVFGMTGHGPSAKADTIIAQLAAADIPVVFIDFRQDPLGNAPKSIAILGRLLGDEKTADAFIAFHAAALKRVDDGLKAVSRRPTVFLESRVGLSDECCQTMVNGMMGIFVDRTGGDNIAKAMIPGAFGTVGIEYLLSRQPDVYIGTAVGSLAHATKAPNRIVLGASVPKDVARASLIRALARPGIGGLKAVRDRRAFAVWHHFYNSPFNVAAVQAFAKWLHPAAFADLDPDRTLATMFERFQPFPAEGTYWIGLE